MKKLFALLIATIMCFSSAVCFAEEVVFSDEAPDMSAEISNILGKDGDFYIIDTNTTVTFNAKLWSISVFGDEWASEVIYDSSYKTNTDILTFTYETDTVRTMYFEKDGGDEFEEDAECIKKGSVLKFNEPGTYYMFIDRAISVDDINAGRYSASGNLRFIVEQGEWIDEEVPDIEDEPVYEEEPEAEEIPAWTIEDELATYINTDLLNISKVVDFDYNYDFIDCGVVICNNEATVTAVTDVSNMWILKMKKTASGWDADYFIEEENLYVDESGFTPKKAGFSVKLEDAGLYEVGCEKDGEITVAYVAVIEETAKYTDSKVMVDGKEIQFEAYNIKDNNYFKLRDIAKVLSGTKKQFGVLWNDELQCIMLTSGTPYTEVGGELSAGDGKAKVAVWGTGDISKDQTQIDIKAYMINGNNYFKLRDLGKLFDFDVSWDEKNNCVLVDSENSYTED